MGAKEANLRNQKRLALEKLEERSYLKARKTVKKMKIKSLP